MSQMPPPNQFPDQTPLGDYSQQPPQKGGGAGKVVVIVLIVLLVLGLICAGVCGLGLLGLGRVTKSIEAGAEMLGKLFNAQAEAQALVLTDEAVRERLGQPLNFGPVESTEAHTDSSTGTTSNFTFDVIGAKETAKAHITLEYENNSWRVTKAEVRCKDGTVLPVKLPSLAPGEINLDLPPDDEK